MAIKDIKISDEQYKGGGSMVVALTQDAINKTFQRWLRKQKKRKQLEFCFFEVYKYEDDDHIDTLTYNEESFKALLGGRDVFQEAASLSDGKIKGELRDKLKRLPIAGEGAIFVLAGAYKVRIGADKKSEKALQLLNSEQIRFNINVASFEKISKGEENYKYKKTEGKNVYIPVAVPLENLTQRCKPSELPEGPKNAVGKMQLNPNTMFHIQQLYVDLANAEKLQIGLTADEKMAMGIKPKEYDNLASGFHNHYLPELRKTGKCLLSQTLVPTSKDPALGEPDFIPRHCRMSNTKFQVGGKPLKLSQPDHRFGTLNYQLSAASAAPQQVIYHWNWLSKAEAKKQHGVMVISKKIFRPFVLKRIQNAVEKMVPVPSIQLEDAEFRTAKVTTSYTRGHKVNCNGNELFVRTEASHSKKGKILTDTGKLWVDFSCQISFIQSMIKLSFSIDFGLHFHTDQSVGNPDYYKGSIGNKTFDLELQLVIKDGSISIQDSRPEQAPMGAGMAWYGYLCDLFDGIDRLKQNLDAAMNAVEHAMEVENLKKELTKNLNGTKLWVFPGGNSFSFNGLEVAQNGDMVAGINYINA